jgi:hypothetical protein
MSPPARGNMRSVRRAVNSLLPIASLLICLALVALSIRSWFVWDTLSRSNTTAEPMTPQALAWGQKAHPGADLQMVARSEGYSLTVWRGRVTLGHGLQKDPMSRWDDAFAARYVDKPIWSHAKIRNDDADYTPPGGEPAGFWGHLGFGIDSRAFPGKFVTVYTDTTVPLWPLVLLTAVGPTAWLRRRLRDRHRTRHGLCLTCGYDLRGAAPTPEVPTRCPECGATPTPTPTLRGAAAIT